MAAERSAYLELFGMVTVLSLALGENGRYVIIGILVVVVVIKAIDSYFEKRPRNEYGWSNKDYIAEQIKKYKEKQ